MKMISTKIVLDLVIICVCQYLTFAQIYKKKGSTVVFTCKYTALPSNGLRWEYRSSSLDPWAAYSSNTDIANVPAAPRITITGNFSIGEYKLNIRDLQESDKGYYRCLVGGTGDVDHQQLIIIVGPTSVQIIGKTSDNKISGTEGQYLQIHCTATGGSPPPNVKLLVAGSQVKTGTQSVSYSTGTLDRSHDGQAVTCQAGYTEINDFSLSDISELYLRLRPFVPTFYPTSVSVIEYQQFEISCTSTGSRPAAVYQWEIGGANITSSSQVTSTTLDSSSSTYTVVSRMSYTLTKDNNGQGLICKPINLAAPGGVPAVPITVNVKYAPAVTVSDMTVTESTSLTVLSCTADGNPDTYTFYEWTHESLQGTLIRTLPGNPNGTLTLPNTNSSLQYQNTGRYTCSVGNGIPDTSTKKTGTGVLTVHAPPVFALYNSWTQGGKRGKTANISVYVYSLSTPSTVSWFRGNTLTSGSGYTISTLHASVRILFYGNEVTMDGYKVTLAIKEVKDADLTTYRVLVGNSRGNNEETLKFVPFGIPDIPTNLAEVKTTEHTIMIKWTAGFNGGYEQTFVIEYRVKKTNEFQEAVVAEARNISHSESHFYTITALKSGTKYDIRIFSRNVIGSTPPSKIITLSTICTCSNCESSSNALIGVAIGLSTVTVISLIVNGLQAYRMINGQTTPIKKESFKPSSDKTSRPEVYYNIAENIEDQDGKSSIEVGTYEELGPMEKPAVYEELKTESSDEPATMKPNTYEELGIKDKPNEYEELNS